MAGGAAVRSAENVSRGRGAALDLVYGVLVVLQEVRIVIVRLRGAGRIFQGSDGRLCVLPPSHTTCRSYGEASEPLEWFPWITSNISEMRVRLNTSDNLRACMSICQVSHVPFFTHVTVTRLSSLAMAPLSCTARLHNPPGPRILDGLPQLMLQGSDFAFPNFLKLGLCSRSARSAEDPYFESTMYV